MPTFTSHLPGDVGPLYCLLGGQGRPCGVGQPAGLESSLGPSLWLIQLVYKSLIRVCGQEKDRALVCELNPLFLSMAP